MGTGDIAFRVPICNASHGMLEKALGLRPWVSHLAFLGFSLLTQIKVCASSKILRVTLNFAFPPPAELKDSLPLTAVGQWNLGLP